MRKFLFQLWPAKGLEAAFGEISRRGIAALLAICMVSCALMAGHILHFATRDDIARNTQDALPLWNPLERIEYSLLDRRYYDRDVRRPKSLDSLAIVAIDETSVGAIGQWPWPRSLHAELVTRLKKAGARVILLDIGFNEPFRPTLDPKTGEKKLSDDDKKLVQAVKRAGNVVLVSHLNPRSNIALSGAKTDVSLIATPFDELDVLTPDLAVNYAKSDTDGGSRLYPLRITKPPETEPLGGIAPLAVAMFQGLVKGDELGAYQRVLKSGQWPDARKIPRAVPLQEGFLPGGADADGRTRVWTTPLYYWGPQGTFPTYSYSNVVDPKQWSDAKLKQHFAGRLVLVGATYHVLKDEFPAPEFGSGGRAKLSGVEVHATMAAMLLDGTYLHVQSTRSALWTLVGLTLVASVWTALLSRQASKIAQRAQAWWARRHWPGRIYGPLWVGLCAALGPLPIYGFWAGAQWAFSNRDLWILALYPALGAAISSGATFLLLFVAESSGRRKVLTQMSRLVAPEVMEEILAHPEEDYPRSRRVHATVLFSDLEGFTSYSESRQPEEVVAALNAYFTRMRPIVHAHGGSVDKFIGDSVMAFFGAPFVRPDHAARALRCALAMQDECARFRRETGIPFWMRIGVHTGDLIVGSVGSDDQLNYTVIGDAVNLASRLEATNKTFGSRIICSADTHREAPDVAHVERSQTPIKGKSGDVEILIVRGPHGEPPRDSEWGHGDLAIDWGSTAAEGYHTRSGDLESDLDERGSDTEVDKAPNTSR